ncbi:MAG: hypothetical protein QXZ20_00890 [Candidatus Aenigmatarchaeota archaeon]
MSREKKKYLKIKNGKRHSMKKEKNKKIEKCPNCGYQLKRFLDEWVCIECEYHSPLPPSKKIEKGSFR